MNVEFRVPQIPARDSDSALRLIPALDFACREIVAMCRDHTGGAGKSILARIAARFARSRGPARHQLKEQAREFA